MSSDPPFPVYVGWDPREAEAFEVCRHSLLRHASCALEVNALVLADCVERGLYTRATERRGDVLWDLVSDAPMATEFALTRFLVPHLEGYCGWAMFCDADFLWRADVAELLALRDPAVALACVHHDHRPRERTKMDGQVQTIYRRKNWSSLMLLNCGHRAHRSLDVARFNTTPGRDLHAFCWLADAEVGALPHVWNWLEGESPAQPEPRAVHYTRGGPWLPAYADVAYADEWRATHAALGRIG